MTAKHVRTKTSLIFGKILERSHGASGAWVLTVLSKSPPTREHDTGGAWVLDHFHAFAVAMGRRIRSACGAVAWSACAL